MRNLKKTLLVLFAVLTVMVGLCFGVSALKETGQCGKNVYWEYNDSTGELVVYGEGEMYDYYFEYFSHSPFSDDNIKTVVVEEGVTSIGDYSFWSCDSLTDIYISSSVNSISDKAFLLCRQLVKITASENNKYYSNDAYGVLFNKNKTTLVKYPAGITEPSYKITNNVKAIGDGAFEDCYSLINVTIPAGVTNIGASVFKGCSGLININVNENNKYYSNDTYGVLFNKNKTTLIQYPAGNIKESYEIPNSVTNIGESAFSCCDNLTRVTIPKSVTNISNNAIDSNLLIYCQKDSYASSYGFKYMVCTDASDEESIFSGKVGKYSWKFDKRTGVLELIGSGDMIDFTSVDAPWYEYRDYVISLKLSSTLTKIGSNSFKDLYRICKVTIPDSVTSIGSSAFYNCDSLISVTIPNSVMIIDNYTFKNCGSLTAIVIGKNVTSIGYEAFCGCDSLKSIIVPDSVTNIDDRAFCSCDRLISVTIGNSVMSIGDNTFAYCTNLESIAIGSSAIIIGYHPFADCNNLEGVTFMLDEKNQSKIVSMPSIRDTMVKDIVLPKSIKTIGYDVFPSTIEKVTVYNPNCEFDTSCGLGYKHTILGFKGSTAETFAEQVGATFIDVETVHKHDYKTVETIKATCETVGKTVKRCTCGKEKTSSIAKLAHKETTVKGKSATCTSTGLTEGKKCSVCGTVTVAQKTVAKKSHTYTTSTIKATLTKNGKTETKCTVCGKVSKTTTVYYPKTITLSASSYTYNGKTKTPSVTVKDSKGKELKKDTDYTVKYESGRKLPGKYTVTVTFKGKYSGTKKLYFTISPKTTSKVTATQTTTSVTLKWSKVTGATGYRVFQRVNGKWKTLTNTTKLTYTIKKLKAGTNYTFAVRPYTVDGKDTILASTFTQLKTATKCKTPTLKVTSSKKGVASLSWTNVAGESGYQVYYSTQKDGEYKKVKSYKTDVVTASKSKLTSGKTYYFKIRAYKKTDSGTVYGAWSAVKSIKIK